MQQQSKSEITDFSAGQINTKSAAETFCGQFNLTLNSLTETIESETSYLRKMKIPEVETLQEMKLALSRTYARDMKTFGANATEIGRLAPVSVDLLRKKHQTLRQVIIENEQLLRAVKDVSESLIRRTAERVANANMPKTYSASASSVTSSQVAAVACDRKL